MGNGIKVSIIVPIYNSQEYVTELFTQLTAQTLKEIEIVFVDDGSTDNTALLLQKHIETVPNAKYIYQQNSGAGAARNKGILEASGDYFICLDADDMYKKDLVEKLYLRASKSSADIAICAFKRIDYWTNREEINLGYTKEWLPSKDVFVADDLKEPFRTFNHGPINKMYRTKFVKDLGLQYSSTKIANDVFFTLSTLLKAERIVFEKENLLTVRRHVNPNSITSNRGLHIADAIRVYKELYEFLVAQDMANKYLPYLCQSVATSFLYNSQYGVSQEFVMELAGWLQQEPWLSWSKQDIKNKFCVHKIEVLKRILNQNIAELEQCKEDKKNSINTQIFFLQNKITNIEMLAEKIESLHEEEKAIHSLDKPLKIPKGNFVLRCMRYVRANGLKSFIYRGCAEISYLGGVKKSNISFWKRIKNYFKRFVPVSKREFQQHITEQKKQQKNLKSNIKSLNENQMQILQEIKELQKKFSSSQENTQKLYELENENSLNEIKSLIQDLAVNLDKIPDNQNKQTDSLIKIERITTETLWAEVWNNTISESSWLAEKNFSPGRFAVGYPFLYVLYRILDEVRPQSILELGLGQSTKMLSQYVQCEPSATHKVVESDKEWIEFFSHNYDLPLNTEVVHLETDIIEKEPGQAVRIFKDFESTFQGQKFDYLCIDAPRGDLSKYTRIDILPLLPYCLKENFIIMVHDCHRIGELNTVKSITSILTKHQIPFHEKNYKGIADTIIICSDDLKFLTTL